MDKKDLIAIIDSVLKPSGYKKRGNYWRCEGVELIKIVNLQKSSYSNLYYINYGFNIKKLKDESSPMHIYRRISSKDSEGKNILDFETEMENEVRIKKIKYLLTHSILMNVNRVNSIDGLKDDLRKQPQLNDVQLNVKEFLNLK